MKATKQEAFAFLSICLHKKVSSFILKFIAAAILLCAPLFAFTAITQLELVVKTWGFRKRNNDLVAIE